MKKCITVITGLMLLISACGRFIKIKDITKEHDPGYGLEQIKYWYDTETSTVHKMICQDAEKKIVSVIKYHDGTLLEVMRIIKCGKMDGRLNWAYYVPSTQYIVELTAVSVAEDKIQFQWKNRTADGVENSGLDILARCDKYGFPRELN